MSVGNVWDRKWPKFFKIFNLKDKYKLFESFKLIRLELIEFGYSLNESTVLFYVLVKIHLFLF